ncbi:MAG: hypothetical protein OEQ53_22220, partial [Saprospiraceae bacterium]|nr:hypothetical protein [Saprospiraceae bacterium]
GISESDDQQVTVLAHSIGGLVARWFVEKEGGNSMVDRLILIGTPNKGSGFGKIDSIRNFATTLLELAVNFSPIQIPGSAYLVKYLQKTGEMTKTLGQISPTSDFLKKLNSAPDPHIPYTMIGGDVSNYEVQGGGFQRMVANTRKKLVTWVNQDETHDFFVGTRSTLHEDVWEDRIPKPIRVAPISCHHMNYLESEAGWEALNEVLK